MSPSPPELLALGDRIAALGEAATVALAKHAAEKLKYEQTRPAVPEELWAPKRHWQSSYTECRGGGDEPSRWIYVSKRIRSEIILNDISRHTKEGKRLRRIARIAKAYEEAAHKAFEATSYFPTYYAAGEATSAYIAAAADLLQHDPVTPAGALIIARAIVDLTAVHSARGCKPHVQPVDQLGAHLAAALLRDRRAVDMSAATQPRPSVRRLKKLREQAEIWLQSFERDTTRPTVSLGEVYMFGGGRSRDRFDDTEVDMPRAIAIDLMRWLRDRAADEMRIAGRPT